jgi:hypothetical protein
MVLSPFGIVAALANLKEGAVCNGMVATAFPSPNRLSTVRSMYVIGPPAAVMFAMAEKFTFFWRANVIGDTIDSVSGLNTGLIVVPVPRNCIIIPLF